MEDKEVLKPLNPEIVETLYQQHLQFRNFLTRHLGNAEVAEEILQESMMKAVQAGGQLEKEESIIAWFYRILRNAMTDYYRTRAAEDRKVSGFLAELVAQGEDRTPAKDQPDPEICQCFVGLLNTLKPAYAELLNRVDLKGEPTEAVARDLEITSANLHVRLHRARQALKASLEKACGTCAKHGCLDCECE